MTVTLAYAHSLYHTPQEELYTVSPGGLILREVHFGSLEAAFYYASNPPGGYLREGGLLITRMPSVTEFATVGMRIPTMFIFTSSSREPSSGLPNTKTGGSPFDGEGLPRVNSG